MANAGFMNKGSVYTKHAFPVHIDCNFTVAAADTGGLGLTGLKGPGVNAVYMHTSQTPPALSPNPASGTILVQLQDNYNKLFMFDYGIISPASGSDVKIDNSAMTAGVAYQITTLGNATAAKWLAIGVPAGVTPAAGVTFVALTNGGAGNTLTSRVQVSAAAGSAVASIEMFGTPGTTQLYPLASAYQGYGAYFILQCRDYAGAIVAPADGSIIQLDFYLSNSSVTVQGE